MLHFTSKCSMSLFGFLSALSGTAPPANFLTDVQGMLTQAGNWTTGAVQMISVRSSRDLGP